MSAIQVNDDASISLPLGRHIQIDRGYLVISRELAIDLSLIFGTDWCKRILRENAAQLDEERDEVEWYSM